LLRDSDRDGLFDHDEVFGVDDLDYPQHLPAWGANPLKKDVFVEQDWAIRATCGTGGNDDCWHPDVQQTNPFTESMALAIHDAFADPQTGASEFEAGNVPGSGDGIFVHIDIGHSCTRFDVCGNWGNGGEARYWPLGEDVTDWSGYTPSVRQNTICVHLARRAAMHDHA
jgi:hypothetical protein